MYKNNYIITLEYDKPKNKQKQKQTKTKTNISLDKCNVIPFWLLTITIFPT